MAEQGLRPRLSHAADPGSRPRAELHVGRADARRCKEILAGCGFVRVPLPDGGRDRRLLAFDRGAGEWVELRLCFEPGGRRAEGLRAGAGLLARVRGGAAGLGVAVLGPDGAGKTTLIAGLERSFPLPVSTIYMGLYQNAGARSPARVRVPGFGLLTNLGRQRLRWLRGLAHRIRGRLVLFDRYTYDALLADPGTLSRLGRLRRGLLGHACPDPDLVVILDAPAQVLFERKGEHDLELLERHRRGLLQLRDGLPQSVVVDATRDSEAVLGDVSAAIWERYGSRAS